MRARWRPWLPRTDIVAHVQPGKEGRRVGKAQSRIWRQAPLNGCLQASRNAAMIPCHERNWGSVKLRVQDRLLVDSVERWRSDEHEVKHGAKRIDVCSSVGFTAREDVRGDVPERTHSNAGPCHT